MVGGETIGEVANDATTFVVKNGVYPDVVDAKVVT